MAGRHSDTQTPDLKTQTHVDAPSEEGRVVELSRVLDLERLRVLRGALPVRDGEVVRGFPDEVDACPLSWLHDELIC